MLMMMMKNIEYKIYIYPSDYCVREAQKWLALGLVNISHQIFGMHFLNLA